MQNFFEQVREGFKHTLPTLSRYAGCFHWHTYCLCLAVLGVLFGHPPLSFFGSLCHLHSVFYPRGSPTGPGVWKLNTSILDDDEYVDLISTVWGRWRQAQGSDPSLIKWWDANKSRIKGSPSHTASKRPRELLLLVIS